MPERISPQEAKRRMDEDGWVYVDVRSVPEFEQGHPNGAYNIPVMHLRPGGMDPNADFVDAFTRAFDLDKKIILGCRSGGRSLRGAGLLERAGFTNVVDQFAGYGGSRGAFGQVEEPGWEALGLPTSNEAGSGKSWSDLSG